MENINGIVEAIIGALMVFVVIVLFTAILASERKPDNFDGDLGKDDDDESQ